MCVFVFRSRNHEGTQYTQGVLEGEEKISSHRQGTTWSKGDPILRDTESLQVVGYIIHILCIYVYAVRIRSKRPKAVTQ